MRAFVYGPENWKNHAEFICSGTSAEADACMSAYKDARKIIDEWIKLSSEEEFKKLVKERLSE